MSQTSFRSATPADLEVLLRHRREMFRDMGERYSGALAEFEDASRRYFVEALSDGSYQAILAESGGGIVAGGGIVIASWPGSPMNFGPRRAWIMNIYVEPAFRRRGIATELARRLTEWCRANGFRSVALHASDEGRRVYERLGFRATNEMRLML